MANIINKISTERAEKKPQSQKKNIYRKNCTWIQRYLM